VSVAFTDVGAQVLPPVLEAPPTLDTLEPPVLVEAPPVLVVLAPPVELAPPDDDVLAPPVDEVDVMLDVDDVVTLLPSSTDQSPPTPMIAVHPAPAAPKAIRIPKLFLERIVFNRAPRRAA
jgi:hypothetical protein